MGVVQNDGISSKLRANSEFLWPVPAHWSLEDAATVPISYLFAFYILFIKADLRKHSTICIHGGAGALGQAIINIALAYDCEIFTTVSSIGKKQFLSKLFPQLQDDHIGSSRDKSFLDMILTITKGMGCNIVISSVKGELKNFYIQCCGLYGIMIDTYIQSRDDYNLGMNLLTKERTYLTVDFESIFQSVKYPRLLHAMIVNGISCGYVRPLTRVKYLPQEASRALRQQASYLNRGRVLLDLRHLAVNIQPRIACSSSSWQLIVSDNVIFTLKIAERLVKQGAKKLVFLLRNPSKCVDVQSRLWEEDGVVVKLISDEISNESKIFDVIQHCQKGSLIESVFIVLTNEKSDINETIGKIAKIIQTARVSLKYFALVRTGNVKNEQTSLQGVAGYQKIITSIKLPEVMMDNQQIMTENAITINSAIDVLERAVCSEKSIILAYTGPTQRKSLWKKLLQIADIRKESLIEKAPLDLTFLKLNLHHSILSTIQGYLRDAYEICLKMEDVQLLSVKRIMELEEESMEYIFAEDHGISSYFTKVDTDELLSSTEKMFLPTLFCPSSRYNEFNTSHTHLCIVPGVEGLYSRFSVLCERLKLSALVLQPDLDHPDETISQLAYRFVEVLLKKVELKDNFYLLGYENGVLVALEMAAVLEQLGLRGTVFCLGGSPTEVLSHFRENLSDYKTSQKLQHAVLKHMYFLMTNEDPDILDKLCKNLSWQEKIDTCMDHVVGKVPHSIQYAKQWIEMAYTRLASLLKYTPEPKKLRSQLISLRPKYSFNGSDLTLQNYSDQNIVLYQLQAPLSSATQDLQCSAIINQHLDSDILKKYETLNICETYIHNASSLLASK